MTVKQATDKLLAEYRAGETWRPYFKKMVRRFTDGADSLGKETFEMVQEYIRKLA